MNLVIVNLTTVKGSNESEIKENLRWTFTKERSSKENDDGDNSSDLQDLSSDFRENNFITSIKTAENEDDTESMLTFYNFLSGNSKFKTCLPLHYQSCEFLCYFIIFIFLRYNCK